MTLGTLAIIVNFTTSVGLYTYFMIDEHRNYAIINKLAKHLNRQEKNLCMIFVGTTYYWMLGTVLWLVE